jgi:hypothetical protein
MADEQFVLEHSIEAEATPAFAWKFRTDIATWHDPPATFLLVGPFAEGARGTTVMPGQEPVAWRIRDIQIGRAFAIEMSLDRATLRFEWQFVAVSDRRTKVTHRVILSGSNTAAYRQQVEMGFGANLASGMAKL